MKTSNKILLITVLVILVLGTVMIITSRIMITRNSNRSLDYTDSEYISKTIVLTDFNSIECSGLWEIDVVQDDRFSVTIEYPEEMADDMNVDTWDNILRIENDKKWSRRRRPFRINITMPTLKNLRIDEGASISFDGFTIAKMEIKINGAAEIDARNSTITDLYLRCDGAADANFRDSRVVNANLNINGASRITLTMDGGKLTGSANGASAIVYYGTVSIQDIAKGGAVSIRHR